MRNAVGAERFHRANGVAFAAIRSTPGVRNGVVVAEHRQNACCCSVCYTGVRRIPYFVAVFS